MESSAAFYSEVVDISRDYLGPAAARFIDRQIKTHLEQEPRHLSPKDLSELMDWIKLAFSVLTNDEKVTQEYIKRLQNLSKRGNKGILRADDAHTSKA